MASLHFYCRAHIFLLTLQRGYFSQVMFVDGCLSETPGQSCLDHRGERGIRPPAGIRKGATEDDVFWNTLRAGPLRCPHRHSEARLWRRSEEHTSELQSLMRSSYAVLCLKKKNKHTHHTQSLIIRYTHNM